ncbi:putative uncharacterized protein [Firmicutes bacterium CAG:791]|nr:putative uncharacterized protein [Firmicutes bacterium CAG:791]
MSDHNHVPHVKNRAGVPQRSASAETAVLQKLMPEYVSLYRIAANSGEYEILCLEGNTNAAEQVKESWHPYEDFDEYTSQYARRFLLPEEQKGFKDWFLCRNMKSALLDHESISYHYQSISAERERTFYEAYAVREDADESHFTILLGFRNIDSILYKEKQVQEKLEKALDDARNSNEIISAIAKLYQYIVRIDLRDGRYEEIRNCNGIAPFQSSGICTPQMHIECAQMAAEEYQEALISFLNLSTLADRMAQNETIATEYRMKNGDWHKLRFIENKRDADGRMTHVLCAIRSISDIKKREQELRYQVTEAKKENALKTRTLRNMSHDLRTPLNGIMGMIEIANQNPDDRELQQKCRDQMLQSSRYLLSLVDDVLAMSKLEAEETEIPDIAFDLTELLGSVNREAQIKAEGKNVSYAVDWERADLPFICLLGNPVYAARLLTAITDNAVKFTEPGGSVRVWCEKKEIKGKQIVYEFGCEDNGIGMSEEFLPHAFEMFAQEKETSRTGYEGSGLGLTIARELALRLGGNIALTSQKGKGTTVRAELPFRISDREELALCPESKERENVSPEGRRALLVEDNELNMEIAQFMLESNGILTDEASDGEEAVAKFAASAPGDYDMIFMDIMMPKMNGWDAARTIRAMQREDAETVPIFAMSATCFAEDIVNSRIAGMNEHLTKPLNEKKLLEVIRKYLRNQRK